MASRGQELAGSEEPADIYHDLIPIWHAFWTLSGSRPMSFGVGGISWGEMSSYCADHGIDGAMRLRWIRLLRAMDSVYLGNVAEESRKRRAEEDRRRGNS